MMKTLKCFPRLNIIPKAEGFVNRFNKKYRLLSVIGFEQPIFYTFWYYALEKGDLLIFVSFKIDKTDV
jgi:hypothetical protein